MRNSLFLAIFLALCLNVKAQNTWQWAVRAGGPSIDSQLTPDETVKDVKTDALGNVYACGRIRTFADFSGTPVTTFGTSGYCMFLAKYDCAGNLIWVKTMGGQRPLNFAFSLVLDDFGHIYLTGKLDAIPTQPTTFADTIINVTSADMFIAKFDTAGNFKWINVAAPGTPILNSLGVKILLDNNGLPNILTWVAGPGQLFPGYNVVYSNYIARFDTSGVINNLILVTSSTIISDHTFNINSNNDIYVTGRFREDTLIIGNNDTTLYRIAGGATGTDLFLIKFDYNGFYNWVIQLGHPNYNLNRGRGISFINSDIILSGEVDDSIYIGTYMTNNPWSTGIYPFAARFNDQGVPLWAINSHHQYGALNSGGNIVADNKIYLTGSFLGQAIFGNDSFSSTGNRDPFLAELDLTGNFIKAEKISTTGGNDEPQAITADAQGNIYIGGGFDGTMSVGSTTVTSAGGKTDAFIAKWGTSNCLTGIEENGVIKASDIYLYPNPASDEVNVVTGLKGRLTVTNYNSSGKTEEIFLLNSLGNSTLKLNTENLIQGIYFTEIKNESGAKIVKKLVIIK